MIDAVRAATASYYGGRATRHGATPLAADWTCVATQEMRFVQLLRVRDPAPSWSVNDLGCGYGALLAFLRREEPGTRVDYCGIDLSPEMIQLARHIHDEARGHDDAQWHVGHRIPRTAEYGLASGLFNVHLESGTDRWEAFVADALAELDRTSRRGFAFNLLSIGGPGVYVPDPERWALHCRDRFGVAVELIRGYGLREVTLLARRPQPPGG